jgi:CubicO group peptidase (beta-lactamase class C family)
MQLLGIPGAAMALIDHGEVVYQGGFGVRELDRPDHVDENPPGA